SSSVALISKMHEDRLPVSGELTTDGFLSTSYLNGSYQGGSVTGVYDHLDLAWLGLGENLIRPASSGKAA
mgnify:CR=1